MYLCTKCNKPFVSERSHDRHARYCGSRIRRRQRSCVACGIAKTKCSFEAPCFRCLQKDIECLYPEALSATGIQLNRPPANFVDSSPHVNVGEPPIHTLSNEMIDGISGLDSTAMESFVAGEAVACMANDVPAQHILLSDPDLAEPHLSPSTHNDARCQSFGDATVTLHGAQNIQVPAWCKWTAQGLSLARVGPPPVQVPQLLQTPAQHSADVIIQSLRAFPTMMLRRETWPWFIHPQSHLLSNSTGIALPQALAACMGIAQMYMLGTVETKPFVWQTVKAEYRGFAEKVQYMSEFELLTATQACMIYFIMCIVEASSENDLLSLELLQVLYELYAVAKVSYGGHTYTSELVKPSSTWADWILAESRRRLTLLWLLVGHVVRVKMNHNPDLSQSHRTLPLPGPKSLWEASSEPTWRSELEASRILQVSGLVCLGDLIDAQNSKHLSMYSRKLDLWNASADNLGLLLNLVCIMV